MKRLLALVLGVTVAAGCGDANVAGPASSPDFSRNLAAPGARGITVMTRNVYLGAELSPVIAAPDIPSLIVAATAAFATIEQTNFPERAQALADEIASTGPHLIGLQEVERYDVVSAADGTPVRTIDFLTILLDALAERGLDYVEAASNTGFSAGAPGFVAGFPGLAFIQLTDRDVILARHDDEVAWSDPRGDDYVARLPVSIAGTPLAIIRGWASVEATVAGVRFRFVDTHFETQGARPIQEAQASELVNTVLGDEHLPVVLVGDFNSAANFFQTGSYDTIVGRGFVDAWAQAHPRDAGLTCCQAERLDNTVSQLDQRLDIVFFRGLIGEQSGRIAGAVRVDIVGESPADRTASGLWPSDHAGVVATLTVPPEVARN